MYARLAMENHDCGFRGWVKWVVVAGAVAAILQALGEFIKGLVEGFSSGFNLPR
jgi:hypothetical protein